MKKFSKDLVYLIVILLFSILGIKALFQPGLFTAHDIWHQAVRIYYYTLAVNDGQIPPYWIGQLANSFGYPLYLFSYHLPWLIGTLFMNMGFTFSDTIKILFTLSYIGSGVTMYFFVKILLKDKLSALLSSLLYLWVPYHFMVIFVGASMGIAFIFTFLPLLLLGIHLIREGSRFGIPMLSVGLSGIILSHIMHIVFLFPVIFIFFLWEFIGAEKKVSFLTKATMALLLGILVSSFYLLPASYYNSYTRVRQESGLKELYKRNFLNFNQLLYSKWGYSPIVNNAKDGEVSFQIGIAQWISAIALLLMLLIKRIKGMRKLGIYLLAGFMLNIFLMTDYSRLVWENIVKVVALDFPFRLILSAVFITSLCTGIILTNLNKKLRVIFFIFLTLTAIYTNRNHLNVNQYINFPIETYLDIETEVTTNTFNEYLPKGANDRLLGKPWNEAQGKNISVSDIKQTTNKLSFKIIAEKEATVSAGQFYFPGQTLYINKAISEFNIDQNGLINFKVSEGIHDIIIRFEDTPVIKLSKILTVIGFLLLLLSLFNPGVLTEKLTSH